jgi:hypothetical protein
MTPPPNWREKSYKSLIFIIFNYETGRYAELRCARRAFVSRVLAITELKNPEIQAKGTGFSYEVPHRQVIHTGPKPRCQHEISEKHELIGASTPN